MQAPNLKVGDTIALISSARKVAREEIQFAINTLETWGLKVVLGENLFHQENQFSGSDSERSEDLQAAINNENIQAILFARGGYGTVRIVDSIDFSALKKKPKWIIGYSDITVLHSHVHRHFNLATLHAPMAFNFTKASSTLLETMRETLFGKAMNYKFAGHKLNRNGTAKGSVVGGNLSILYSLLGSPSDIDTDGKILFLEDLDEYLYHIDRMVMNLKRNGKLSKLAGLIVGGMSDMKDNLIPFGKTAEEIIFDAVKEFNYPVCFNFPAGHVEENLPLTLGAAYDMKVGETVSINSITKHGRA